MKTKVICTILKNWHFLRLLCSVFVATKKAHDSNSNYTNHYSRSWECVCIAPLSSHKKLTVLGPNIFNTLSNQQNILALQITVILCPFNLFPPNKIGLLRLFSGQIHWPYSCKLQGGKGMFLAFNKHDKPIINLQHPFKQKLNICYKTSFSEKYCSAYYWILGTHVWKKVVRSATNIPML